MATDDVSRWVGRNVERLRTEIGLTLAELAKPLGWDLTILSKIENGRRRVSVDDVVALAVQLGVTPGVLMAEPDRSASLELQRLINEREDLVARFEAQQRNWERGRVSMVKLNDRRLAELDSQIEAELKRHPEAKEAVQRLRTSKGNQSPPKRAKNPTVLPSVAGPTDMKGAEE